MTTLIADSVAFLLLMMPLIADSAAFLLLMPHVFAHSTALLMFHAVHLLCASSTHEGGLAVHSVLHAFMYDQPPAVDMLSNGYHPVVLKVSAGHPGLHTSLIFELA